MLRGHRNTKITVISAYQVVKDPPNTGIISAVAQQRSLLMLAQDPIVTSDPRQAFKRNLISQLRTCVDNNERGNSTGW